MVRSEIVTNNTTDFQKAYELCKEMKWGIKILRIVNGLTLPLRTVTLNYRHGYNMIGEIQLRYGGKAIDYHSKVFINELIKADNP